MKSLKEYSLNLKEEDYHAYPAWSYSTIARYAKDGFSAMATLHDSFSPTPAMEFGSLFDSMVTKGKKTLEEYIVDDTACPPAEKNVFDYLLAAGHREPFVELQPSDISIAMDECAFYPKYKYETKVEKLTKAFKYYETRRVGKKIVSRQDWNDAIEMLAAFRENEVTGKLFKTENTEDMEYIYQAQFLEEYSFDFGKEVPVKIMPDLLVVNHKEKTIQPVDLKTSAVPAFSFSENFVKYRYDLQAGCYTDILRLVISKDPDYKDYTVLPFIFADISRTDKVPVTYVYNPDNGFSYTKGDKTYHYKSWDQLLEEIIDYEEADAVVPSYISLSQPNDIIDILSR